MGVHTVEDPILISKLPGWQIWDTYQPDGTLLLGPTFPAKEQRVNSSGWQDPQSQLHPLTCGVEPWMRVWMSE